MFESKVRELRKNVIGSSTYFKKEDKLLIDDKSRMLADMSRENSNNILITEEICNHILKTYKVDYKVKNLEFYQRAFVHTSYLIDDPNSTTPVSMTNGLDKLRSEKVVSLQPTSYERLEYIGDAILNAATAHYVFQRYPLEDEGFMTTLRTKLVRSKTLARITKKLKLHKYILLSLYTDKFINGRNNCNILEDVFEAWVGALYLDAGPDLGFGICLKFISNVFEKWVDMVNMINRDDNYKKNLLEYYQKRFRTEAKYQIISVRGRKPHKIYTMGALSPTGEIIGIGQAKKKVDADQMASKQALIYYGEEVEESEEDSLSDHT